MGILIESTAKSSILVWDVDKKKDEPNKRNGLVSTRYVCILHTTKVSVWKSSYQTLERILKISRVYDKRTSVRMLHVSFKNEAFKTPATRFRIRQIYKQSNLLIVL